MPTTSELTTTGFDSSLIIPSHGNVNKNKATVEWFRLFEDVYPFVSNLTNPENGMRFKGIVEVLVGADISQRCTSVDFINKLEKLLKTDPKQL